MQDPQKVVARANRAVELLADPLVVEAKSHIEAELYRQFQRLAPSDVEGLQFVKGMQYLHDKYFAFLSSAVSDGKIARLEIERKEPKKRFRVGSVEFG